MNHDEREVTLVYRAEMLRLMRNVARAYEQHDKGARGIGKEAASVRLFFKAKETRDWLKKHDLLD